MLPVESSFHPRSSVYSGGSDAHGANGWSVPSSGAVSPGLSWYAAQPTPPIPGFEGGGSGKMVLDAMKAGALVVAGTDTPNAINLHGELMAYTLAGMSNFDALKAATVNPARALAVETGTIEAGKIADLIVVDGDPLVRMADLHKIKKVVANGRLYEISQLINGAGSSRTSTQR